MLLCSILSLFLQILKTHDAISMLRTTKEGIKENLKEILK